MAHNCGVASSEAHNFDFQQLITQFTYSTRFTLIPEIFKHNAKVCPLPNQIFNFFGFKRPWLPKENGSESKEEQSKATNSNGKKAWVHHKRSKFPLC